MLISSNNIMLNCKDTIREITSIYFKTKSLPICYFEYNKIYFAGTGIFLDTLEPNFLKQYLTLDLYPTLIELQSYPSLYAYLDINFYRSSYINDPSRWLNGAKFAEQYNLRERFYVIKRHANYMEMFGFTLTPEHTFGVQNYLEFLPLLHSYIAYFKDSSHYLLNDCEKEKINMGERFLVGACTNERLKKNDVIIPSLGCLNISKREYECLSLIAEGYTMKMVGKKLGISPRTVEKHLLHLKEKNQVHSKNQLIELWHNTQL